jgi:hypothetical protein
VISGVGSGVGAGSGEGVGSGEIAGSGIGAGSGVGVGVGSVVITGSGFGAGSGVYGSRNTLGKDKPFIILYLGSAPTSLLFLSTFFRRNCRIWTSITLFRISMLYTLSEWYP